MQYGGRLAIRWKARSTVEGSQHGGRLAVRWRARSTVDGVQCVGGTPSLRMQMCSTYQAHHQYRVVTSSLWTRVCSIEEGERYRPQCWFLATRSLSQIFISQIFISQMFISKVLISKIFISKIFISEISYLHTYEINILDMTRYLCPFVD